MQRHGYNSIGEALSGVYVEKEADYGLDFGDEISRTRQEFAEDADINVIMARYEKTGQLPVPGLEPVYLDLASGPVDLQAAMDTLYNAEEAFMRLPAATRREFDNDPVKFVAFAQDEGNLSKMREWGLAKPAELPPEPIRVQVTNPEPASNSGSGGSPAAPAGSEA